MSADNTKHNPLIEQALESMRAEGILNRDDYRAILQTLVEQVQGEDVEDYSRRFGLDKGEALPDGILAAYLRGWKDGRRNLDPRPTQRCEMLEPAQDKAKLAAVKDYIALCNDEGVQLDDLQIRALIKEPSDANG